MSDILKQEYDVGFLDDDGLAWYVRHNALSKDDFNFITGSKYDDKYNQSTKGND